VASTGVTDGATRRVGAGARLGVGSTMDGVGVVDEVGDRRLGAMLGACASMVTSRCGAPQAMVRLRTLRERRPSRIQCRRWRLPSSESELRVWFDIQLIP
jgi:hypothetical protein